MLEIKELRQARDEALSQVESLQTMVELVRNSQLEAVQCEKEGDFYRRFLGFLLNFFTGEILQILVIM